MAKKRPRRADRPAPKPRPGEIAQAQGRTLNSYRLGALPMLETILRRLRLEEFLRDRLPREDPRTKLPTATGLLLLIKTLLDRSTGDIRQFWRRLHKLGKIRFWLQLPSRLASTPPTAQPFPPYANT